MKKKLTKNDFIPPSFHTIPNYGYIFKILFLNCHQISE